MIPAPLAPLVGGSLIGLSVAALLLFNGRVAGVSGIVGGLVARAPGAERIWRALFVAGLLAGGLVAERASPEAIGVTPAPLPVLVIAGVLVGFGARLGGGCTSGHGVCGVSRLSLRSIVATGTFMLVAGVVVFVLRRSA
jgi:uncharacterized membrane protein YedE/YeeE